MNMKPFPFVEIPEQLRPIVGNPDPGTRLFKAYLWKEDYRRWFLSVDEIAQRRGLLNPVDAAAFIGVARIYIYRWIKSGRLTGFQFHEVIQGAAKGMKPVTQGQPIYFIPFIECMAMANKNELVGDKAFDDYRTSQGGAPFYQSQDDPLDRYLNGKEVEK